MYRCKFSYVFLISCIITIKHYCIAQLGGILKVFAEKKNMYGRQERDMIF